MLEKKIGARRSPPASRCTSSNPSTSIGSPKPSSSWSQANPVWRSIRQKLGTCRNAEDRKRKPDWSLFLSSCEGCFCISAVFSGDNDMGFDHPQPLINPKRNLGQDVGRALVINLIGGRNRLASSLGERR